MALPGSRLSLKAGTYCDDHYDVLAVVAIQGETDSFGYETIHMCEQCYSDFKSEAAPVYDCDYCHKEAPCYPVRDSGEGTHGPVYWVCESCKKVAEERDDFC